MISFIQRTHYPTQQAIKSKTKSDFDQPVDLEAYKDYTDTLIGNHCSNTHVVVYSKFFIYVYEKNGKLIEAIKLSVAIIQVEIVINKSLGSYGVELEIITSDKEAKCDVDEVDNRDNLVIYYQAVYDSEKLAITSEIFDDLRPTKEEAMSMYLPSANRIECHSCFKMTRDKNKLFTCTEICDNIIEKFRKRQERTIRETRNVWKYDGNLDDNKDPIAQLILSNDERYMLAVMKNGFKVGF